MNWERITLSLTVLAVLAAAAHCAEPPPDPKKITNKISKEDRRVFGAFGFIERTCPYSEVLTRPKTQSELEGETPVTLIPVAGQIITRHEHLVWDPVEHTETRNRWSATAPPGKRVYVTIQGFCRWKNPPGGQSRPGGPSNVEPPKWWSSSIDVDLDADTNRDGIANVKAWDDMTAAEKQAESAEDKAEDKADLGALVAVGEPIPLRLRRVMPATRPQGEVRLKREYFTHVDVLQKVGNDYVTVFSGQVDNLISKDLWSLVKDAGADLRIVGRGMTFAHNDLALTYRHPGKDGVGGTADDLVFEDKIRVSVVMDLDTDSNNDGMIYGDEEDAIEDVAGDGAHPGKVIPASINDVDNDGIPDFADGFNWDRITGTPDDTSFGLQFARAQLWVKEGAFNVKTASYRISYTASPPAEVERTHHLPYRYTPAPGNLRLWKQNGSFLRSLQPANSELAGDYMPPGVYTYEQMGLTALVSGMHKTTFYVEGIAGTTAGGQRVVVEIDPDGAEGPAGFVVSDAIRFTVVGCNIDVPNVTEQDEETRGGALALNNDNDDFNPTGAHNYQPDREQVSVPGENDLCAVRLGLNLRGVTVGMVRLDMVEGATGNSADDTRVKVWASPEKNLLLLDGATRSHTWTAAQWNALTHPYRVHVEGFTTSGSVRDIALRLGYSGQTTATEPDFGDTARFTTVQLILDVNRDNAVTDDNPNYSPGYNLAAPPQPEISAPQWAQRMRLILYPVDAQLVDISRFALQETSNFTGVCMNKRSDTGPDFSFDRVSGLLNCEVSHVTGDQSRADFFCRDYGGRTVVTADVLRAGLSLARCELRIPVDTDRDTLPDLWEDTHANDPVRARQIFDTENPETLNVPAAGGAPRIPPMNAGEWDHETRDPAAAGDPPNGRVGDGLVAFEEYRGFFHGDENDANHRHRRTSPHRMDVFGLSIVTDIDAARTDMGLGFLLDPASGNSSSAPHVRAHRIENSEWDGVYVRSVNFNRTGIPGATLQRAIFLTNTGVTGFGDNGVARGHMNTGPNGVCNTEVPNAANAAVRLDFQLLPINRGLPEQKAISPGINGFIDPLFAVGDRVDWQRLRIVSNTADGHLHTLTLPTGVRARGYVPDDRIRGTIRGPAGAISPATVAAMDAAHDALRGRIEPGTNGYLETTIDSGDIVKGEVRPGPDGRLQKATVLAVDPAKDSLAEVIIHPGADGRLDSERKGDDVLNADNTIGPGNNGRFESALADTDEFRGIIKPGVDGILDLSGLVWGDDRIFGTIEEGTDNKLDTAVTGGDDVLRAYIAEGGTVGLQSRPAAGSPDFVIGYVEDGGNGFLDPTVNNAGTAGHGVQVDRAPAGTWALLDDYYDPFTGRVNSGGDGIRNTNPQPGSDDVQTIPNAGWGTPFTWCIDADDHDGTDEPGGDDTVDVAPAGDDIRTNSNEAADTNSDVNDLGYIYINAGAFNRIIWVLTVTVAGPPSYGHLVNRDLRLASGAPATVRRRRFLNRTMAHECGHAMHMAHYNITTVATPGGVPDVLELRPPAGHAVTASPMVQTGSVTIPVETDFDDTDLEQLRLHQKPR